MEFRVTGDRRRRMVRGYATFAPLPLYPHQNKAELSRLFPDVDLLSSIASLENPLQKNLGDSYCASAPPDRERCSGPKTLETADMNPSYRDPSPPPSRRGDFFPALFGITNFITGFFHNITGAMSFHQNRPPSPEVSELFASPEEVYYDSEPVDSGFDEFCDAAAPGGDEVDSVGHLSRRDRAKNSGEAERGGADGERAQCDARGGPGAPASPPAAMTEVRDAAEHCRGKMARIREMLAAKAPGAGEPAPKTAGRLRPRRVFVEPKAVGVAEVESFRSEPLARLEGDPATKYVQPGRVTQSELARVENHPRVKLEVESKDVAPELKPAPIADATAAVRAPDVAAALQNDEVKDKSGADRGIGAKPAVAGMSDAMNKHDARGDTEVIDENARDLRGALTGGARTAGKSAPPAIETKAELITSCEDKVSRLKALLFERKRKNRETQRAQDTKDADVAGPPLETTPAPTTQTDGAGFPRKVDTRRSPERPIPAPERRPPGKHHKNPDRLGARKQKRKQLRRNIDEDLRLARELDGDSSPEGGSPKLLVTPPSDGFDEVRGQFDARDDPFVIVFAESPPGGPRSRLPSDCGSEDSFIVFEEEEGAPGCFTSEDAFESTDSDSGSDSGCESNLASLGAFSRTLGDLTDESLYREAPDEEEEEEQGGLLLTEAKKIARRSLPPKKVRFSEAPPRVRVMRVWLYAARRARTGNWRELAIDRERFKRRIADVDMAISWVLKPQHRSRVKFQRFMPWWHAQRRQEAAERKEAAERQEEERKEAEKNKEEEDMKEAEEIETLDDKTLTEEAIVEDNKQTDDDNGKERTILDVEKKQDMLGKKEDSEIDIGENTGSHFIENATLRDNVDISDEFIKQDQEQCINPTEIVENITQKGFTMADRIQKTDVAKGDFTMNEKKPLQVTGKTENTSSSKLDVKNKEKVVVMSAGEKVDISIHSECVNVDSARLIMNNAITNLCNANLDRSSTFANPAIHIGKNGLIGAHTAVTVKKS